MNYLAALREVKGFIFDVDGVLTDSTVMILEDGSLLRTMNVRDGLALKIAIEAGYFVGIITGGNSEGVIKRLRKLGIEAIYAGVENKKKALLEIIDLYDIQLESMAYMGDDLPDLAPLHLVGLACCPKNASPEVKSICRYISPLKGGKGCVRDLIEKTLKIAGNWPAQNDKQK